MSAMDLGVPVTDTTYSPITVAALRRYPVKSMGGEDLHSVELDQRGVVGDRWWAVEDEDGRFASGKNTRRFRRYDGVFAHTAATTDTGAVTVTSAAGQWTVGDPALDDQLTRTLGRRVRVTPEGPVPHQDSGSVSLVGTATLAWCAQRWGLNADPRRLRVNILLTTDEPFVEEGWVGQEITIGSAVLRVVEPIPRCRTIDLDQDGAVASGRWLKPLTAERDACVAMYADVVTPGTIAVGEQLWWQGGVRL